MTSGFPSSVSELRSRYLKKEASPSEVLEAVLAGAEILDGTLSAFRVLLADDARKQAAARTADLTADRVLGPLHGVPVAVKELFDVAGAPAAYGSRVLAGRTALRDAVAVQRLRQAGAVIVGLTRSHEFGWGITTQHALDGGTRNPWNPHRVPGGSSGGSAAAVAAGLVPVALGSDTGGSIRIPSAFCGVAGLKPTFGSVSSAGAVPLAPSLDHVGPIAARVEDLWLTWQALRDNPSRELPSGVPDLSADAEPQELAAGLRIGIAPDLNDPPLANGIARVFGTAVATLADLGCPVSELSLESPQAIRATFATIQMAEAYHVHTRILATYPAARDQYGPDVRSRLEQAASITLADYLDARIAAQGVRHAFAAALTSVDVLLTPVSAAGPSTVAAPDRVMHLDHRAEFRDVVMNFTTPQNLTGLPACSVAVGLDDEQMPVGVQITAASGREDLAVRVAAALQRALPLPAPQVALPPL